MPKLFFMDSLSTYSVQNHFENGYDRRFLIKNKIGYKRLHLLQYYI